MFFDYLKRLLISSSAEVSSATTALVAALAELAMTVSAALMTWLMSNVEVSADDHGLFGFQREHVIPEFFIPFFTIVQAL